MARNRVAGRSVPTPLEFIKRFLRTRLSIWMLAIFSLAWGYAVIRHALLTADALGGADASVVLDIGAAALSALGLWAAIIFSFDFQRSVLSPIWGFGGAAAGVLMLLIRTVIAGTAQAGLESAEQWLALPVYLFALALLGCLIASAAGARLAAWPAYFLAAFAIIATVVAIIGTLTLYATIQPVFAESFDWTALEGVAKGLSSPLQSALGRVPLSSPQARDIVISGVPREVLHIINLFFMGIISFEYTGMVRKANKQRRFAEDIEKDFRRNAEYHRQAAHNYDDGDELPWENK